MLMNALDPEVAERPDEMIACGTNGKPVEDWQSYLEIAVALKTLDSEQTLLVQPGKPAESFRTSAPAPRVLIKPVTTDGEEAATSWMYVGTQGALQETYETFRSAARVHFGGDLAGRLVVSAGMGSLGGAQPLAAQLNGAAFLGIDADPARIKRRVKSGYCDVMVSSLDEALRILKNAVRQRAARSVGLVGNAADVISELAERGSVPDILTDRTAAQDPLLGYWPQGLSMAEASDLRRSNPAEARRKSLESIAVQVRAMMALQKLGASVFDFGNRIFAKAREAGVAEACPEAPREEHRSVDRAPMRWIALSGEPGDIDRIDRLVLEMFSGDENLARFIRLARKHVRAQGLPARVCWMRSADRARFGVAVNELVADGDLRGPVVLGRDFLDCGGAAERRAHPRLAIAQGGELPIGEELLDATNGASWAAIRGSGADPARLAQAIVADGTSGTAARIEQVMSR